MAEQQAPREQVGSVAEEAAKLVEALGGWAQSAAARQSAADEPSPGRGGSPEGPGQDTAGHCEQCGAANGTGQAVACQLCPVCQGIALLRAVRPETVDRLADLAAALSATLRDLAADRRPSGAGGPPARASRVQDIDIDDDAVPTDGSPTP